MKRHAYLLIAVLYAVTIWDTGTRAGIIPAILPAATPTANKRGNSNVFALASSNSSAAAGMGYCDDGSGNLTSSGCSFGGTSGGGGFPGYSANIPNTTLTGTIFFPPTGGVQPSTTEGNVQANAPYAATGNDLYVVMSVAPGVGNSIAFTIDDAGSATSVTCTISGAATTCHDTTHTFTGTAGDLLDVKGVVTGTPGSSNIQFTFNYGGPATGLIPNGFYLLNGTSYYIGPTFQLATLPVAGSFAWVNQSGATETASGNALVLVAPAGSGDSVRIREQAISSNTTLTANLSCTAQIEDHGACGIGFRESATGKLLTLANNLASSNGTCTPNTGNPNCIGPTIQIARWNSATSFNNTQYLENYGPWVTQWAQLNVSGGNLSLRISNDGVHFVELYTEASNAFFTTAPDQWFYFANANNATLTQAVTATLFSFKMQ